MEQSLVNEVNELRKKILILEKSASELRRVEQALRESELRYRSLIKQSSDGVYIFDPETARILEANDQFIKMIGYSEDEIVNLTMYDIVKMDRGELCANIQKTINDREYVFGLRQYLCKNGCLVDVEISSTLINYGDSNVIMVNVRNVSERLQAENELKEKSRKLKEQAELLDIAEDAIIVGDLHGVITYWNRGAETRYGWSAREALGKNIHKLLKTEFPEPFVIIRETLLGTEHWEGELVHTSKDGKKIIVEAQWSLRRAGEGRPMAVMEINNDITKYKETQMALQKTKDELEHRVAERTIELREANEKLIQELGRRKRIEGMLQKGAERYRNLFENSPIGIYRTNPDGRILMANPTLVRMLGYNSFNDLASSPYKRADYVPSYLKKKLKKRLEKEERVRGFETKWKRPDSTIIYVRENAKAVRGADRTTQFYEGTVEDISEQKKAAEKIDSYQNQLRSLASDLSLAEERERRRIATVLHDQIGQILAMSKIKLGALIELSETKGIADELKEVRQYVEQAILYTRSLTSELSPPVLYELGLEAALEWLIEQIHEQHSIEYEFESDELKKPLSDELRVFLFTAVRELLVNVTKHAKASMVKVTVRRVGGFMSIHVADDGIGFNASKMHYYHDENKGYGLFSVRERLKHLGGQADIRSQKGRGTRISLLAPLNL